MTFISVPGSVAADSFPYAQMVAGFTVGQLIVAFVLIPVHHRPAAGLALYEYLDNRFGVKSHRTGAWFSSFRRCWAPRCCVYVLVCAVIRLHWRCFFALRLPFWGGAPRHVFSSGSTPGRAASPPIWTDTL